MKKQTLEEVALSFLPNSEVEHDTDFIIGFEFGAKWQQEQAKAMEKEQQNNLPIYIHDGISNTHVYIEDGVVHVKPN